MDIGKYGASTPPWNEKQELAFSIACPTLHLEHCCEFHSALILEFKVFMTRI
jgi:hypothetical protein